MTPWPLIRYAAILLGVGIVAWAIYAHIYDIGYDAGKADAVQHYEPLLADIERRAHEAQGRADALQKARKAVDHQLEAQHAQFQKTLAERSGASQRRIDQLLRDAQAARDRCRVPAAGTTPGLPDGAAGRAERDRRDREAVAASARALGERFERDAHRLHDWQQRAKADAALNP